MRRGVRVVTALAAVVALSGCGGDDGGAADVSTDAGVTSATAATVTTVPAGEPVTAAEAATLPDGSTVPVRAYAFEPDEGATVLCDCWASRSRRPASGRSW